VIKTLITLLVAVCIPAFATAQAPPPITASPCYWLYSIPYIESNDEGADPGQRELATSDIALELRELGVVHMVASEVGGNRAVTCIIAGRMTEEQRKPIRWLLSSIGQGTRITEQIARELFDAPWYQIYLDPETMGIAFFDG
jgi:hypothetical protein